LNSGFVADPGKASPRVFFGGGRRPPGNLRELLLERIAAVPAGGSIDWVTYYLRDYGLAEALVAARRRGVRVSVTVEKRPRTGGANREIASFLAAAEGLGSGFRQLSLPRLPYGLFSPRLHGKLYCFSHPRPGALIGSFNPSGSGIECGAAREEREKAIIAEIGDQDRGYNYLVELTEEKLVAGLVLHARWLHRLRPGWGLRADFYLNRHLKAGETEVFFWPRVRPHPVFKLLRRLGPGTRVRLAASHLRGMEVVGRLLGLVRMGLELEIIAEATERRVPARVEENFRRVGVSFRRVGLDSGLPMHDKFVLVSRRDEHWVAFGSFNWTTRSRWFNYEIGALSTSPGLYQVFTERWRELEMAAGLRPVGASPAADKSTCLRAGKAC